ncbi:MAG: mucoidy inhibitor MuiA family protein, partial [Alphaproteobacteria bacterium]|nr:mucoidy inhibitor MuiA family protein [Alphaproteobacteria bacterium]
MKAIILTIFAVFLSTAALGADITGRGTVREATVFPHGAIIQRIMTVNIPQGASRISMEGLPVDADQRSIRVDGRGDFSIGAVDIVQQVARDAVNAREREITAKIDAVDKQIMVVQSEIAALQKSSEFITSLWQNREHTKQNFTLESWPQVFKSYTETSRQSIEKQRRLAELQKDRDKLTAELAAARGGGRATLTAVVNVQAPRATAATINVSYMVRSARWAPVYDARLDTRTSQMQVVMYGLVHQTTGDDWSDVSLTLSTARPAVGTQMPQLSTHWIDYEPQNARQTRGAPDMAMGAGMMAAPRAAMVMERDSAANDMAVEA